jgi:hypothetical protein
LKSYEAIIKEIHSRRGRTGLAAMFLDLPEISDSILYIADKIKDRNDDDGILEPTHRILEATNEWLNAIAVELARGWLGINGE